MARLLLFVALGLTLVVCALANGYNYGGPCEGGYWPDGKGCCPDIINYYAYYRDGNKCYPKDVGYGQVLYADGNGCYPDEKGEYLAAGKYCPHERKCYEQCIRPKYESTTTQYYPPKTTTHEEYKTTTKYYPPVKTTTKEYYPPPKTTTQENKQCPGNQWKDGNGCCPRYIGKTWFYRDGRGCYPKEFGYGQVLYADGNGCYPDSYGKYLAAGEYCPKDRQCHPECDGKSY